jgi:hypothetical protein
MARLVYPPARPKDEFLERFHVQFSRSEAAN